MKRTILAIILGIIIGGTSCFSNNNFKNTNTLLSDKNATTETITLYQKLNKLKEKGYLIGHQDDLAYGVNWKYEEGRSDIKDVVGDYPALYGWDIAGIEKDDINNIDGVPFLKMKQYIKESHERGGITTISWHMDNPLTGKNAWDNTSYSLKTALPGGENHEKLKNWLDKEANFFLSLKDKKGKLIPILYRPFHELTGNWFWWGKGNCTPDEFKQLWKFAYHYLQQKGVHNLIYIYNTGGFKTINEFSENYPGKEYVDILSFDNYQFSDPTKDNSFVEQCQNQFKIISEFAEQQNKLIAFAEAGYEGVPYAKWWTETLVKAIGDYKISFVLIWRNHGWQEKEQKMHYYAPFKGQISEKDFVEFYNLNKTLFEKDIKKVQK